MANDSDVTVTLRANLKDYEAALKTAVRATEKAAKAAEAAVAGVGKKAKPDFTPLNDNFQKSAAQIANDARIMQFQLNDVFSGLASGQGIRALQVQLGQIAQQMSGGSLAAGARILGSAMIGMINPINLAVVAFGLAATAAASYFSSAKKDAEEARKELDKQAAAVKKLADEYGGLFPELARIAKLRQDEADAAGKAEAKTTALAGAYEDTQKTLGGVSDGIEEIIGLLQLLGARPEDIIAIQDAFKKLDQAVADYKATSSEAKPAVAALDAIIASSSGKVLELATNIRTQLIESFKELDRAAASAGQTIQNSLQFQMPGAGGPLDLAPLQRARERAAQGTPSGAIEFLKTKAASQAIADSLDRLDAGMAQALVTLFRALPDTARITSGVRTFEEQARLRARYEAGTGGLAAPAGRSRHEFGKAVDIGAGVDMETLRQAVQMVPELEQLKGRLYEQDKVHVQLVGTQIKVEQEAADAAVNAAQKRADAAAKGQEAYSKEIATQQRSIDQQLIHNNMMVDSSKTIDQRKLAVEADTIAQQLNQAAIANGVTLTAELIAKHKELAMSMAMASQAAVNIGAAQQKAAQDAIKAAQEQKQALENLRNTIASMAVSAISGFVQDLRNGVDAAEALYNAVSRIADQLLSMALNMAFKAILGGIGGGPVGLFASGGYTGDRSARVPAGIVHGQEFVVNAQATKRHRNLLESINKGLPGYASGGFVLPRMTGGQISPSQQAAVPQVNTRNTIVNAFDSGSFLSEALSRPDGVNVILNVVRAQPGAFRQAMQG